MSKKTFFSLLLIGFYISACGAPAATQNAAPPEAPGSVATEAPAATNAPAEVPQFPNDVAESEFNFISPEKASSTDIKLYKSLSALEPAPLDETALAVALGNLDPTKIPTAPNQPVNTYQPGQVRTFWVQNTSTLEFNLINAQLMFISDHAYFWQDMYVNQAVNPQDWQIAAESFDASYE